MTPRTCRWLIATGLAMAGWSACLLVAMHGGLLLSEVGR